MAADQRQITRSVSTARTAQDTRFLSLDAHRAGGLGEQIWRHRSLMIMLVPALLYFTIFKYGPIFGLVIAFQDFRPTTGQSIFASIARSDWVGFRHFVDFLASRRGLQVLINTIVISVYKIVFGFPAPILLALLLNEIRNSAVKRVVQSCSYLPHFMSWVILAGIVRILLSPDYGLIVPVFELFNMEPINFIGDPRYFRGLLVITDIWQSVGWGSIIYLAALSAVDPELYQAAMMDGAGRFRQIVSITIPCISSTIVIMFILRVGRILVAGFDQVFNLYTPFVYSVADIIDTYVYRIGLEQFRFSYTAAITFFQSVMGFALVLLTNFMARRLGEEGIW